MTRVCVFAGSNSGRQAEYVDAARELGLALVTRGLGLVYGGARIGLMGAVADAVLAGGGEVIGVIPAALVAKEVAHEGLTELRVVSSMHERKAQMADLADGFVALPGGLGTLEELFEVLTWAQLGLHRKPCGVLNTQGYFDGVLAMVEHAITEGFVRREHGRLIAVSEAPGALLAQLAEYSPPDVQKWLDSASA